MIHTPSQWIVSQILLNAYFSMIRFKEVYQSKHGKVRIYKIMSVSKDSKEWVPKNRLCDAPGSWYCPGQYPPGLQKVLKEKKDFRQVRFLSYL